MESVELGWRCEWGSWFQLCGGDE